MRAPPLSGATGSGADEATEATGATGATEATGATGATEATGASWRTVRHAVASPPVRRVRPVRRVCGTPTRLSLCVSAGSKSSHGSVAHGFTAGGAAACRAQKSGIVSAGSKSSHGSVAHGFTAGGAAACRAQKSGISLSGRVPCRDSGAFCRIDAVLSLSYTPTVETQ